MPQSLDPAPPARPPNPNPSPSPDPNPNPKAVANPLHASANPKPRLRPIPSPSPNLRRLRSTRLPLEPNPNPNPNPNANLNPNPNPDPNPKPRLILDPTRVNRLLVCIFAVVLLWGTTLRVAIAVTQAALPSTTVEAVYDSCEYAFDEALRQEGLYAECAGAQMRSCERSLDEQFSRELEASRSAAASNAATIEAASSSRTQCSADMTDALSLLSAWVALNDVAENGAVYELAFRGGSACSAAERVAIRDMVGDAAALSSEAYRASADFADESVGAVAHVAGYAKDVHKYNRGYVGNKTDGIQAWLEGSLTDAHLRHGLNLNLTIAAFIDGLEAEYGALLACVAPVDGAQDSCQIGAAEVRSARRQLEDAIEEVFFQGMEVHATLKGYEAYVDDFLRVVTPLYKQQKDFFNAVDGFFRGIGIDPGSLSFWPDIPFSRWFPDYTLELPTVDVTDTFDTYNIDDKLDAIYASVAGATDAYAADLRTLSAQADLSALNAELSALPNSAVLKPHDYEPPVYIDRGGQAYAADEVDVGLDGEVSAFQGTAEEYSAVMEQILEALNDAERTNVTDGAADAATTAANVTYSDGLQFVSNLDFKIVGLSASRVAFADWLLSFDSLADVLVLFDYLWRLYYTFVIIHRFWRRGGLRVPDVDVRVDGRGASGAAETPLQRAARLLTLPAVPVIVAALFAVIAASIMSTVLVPLFLEYRAGCVDNSYQGRMDGVSGEGTGTFLTENMYSMAYNYASRGGNQRIYDGLDAFNVRRTELCAEHGTDSTNAHAADDAYFRSIVASHSSNFERNELLERCIDVDAMDAMISEACSCEEGAASCSADRTYTRCPRRSDASPYEPLSATIGPDGVDLGRGPCDVDLSDNTTWHLRDATFDCANLDACHYGCSGVNAELLLGLTYDCGCEFEFLGFSGIAAGALAILIYALAQASRALAVAGVIRVNWAKLHPGVFTFRATCDEGGRQLANPNPNPDPNPSPNPDPNLLVFRS